LNSQESFERATALLKTKIDIVHKIADALQKYETLSADDLDSILKGEDISLKIEEQEAERKARVQMRSERLRRRKRRNLIKNLDNLLVL